MAQTRCPYCSCKLNVLNLQSHTQSKCRRRPANGHAAADLSGAMSHPTPVSHTTSVWITIGRLLAVGLLWFAAIFITIIPFLIVLGMIALGMIEKGHSGSIRDVVWYVSTAYVLATGIGAIFWERDMRKSEMESKPFGYRRPLTAAERAEQRELQRVREEREARYQAHPEERERDEQEAYAREREREREEEDARRELQAAEWQREQEERDRESSRAEQARAESESMDRARRDAASEAETRRQNYLSSSGN